MRILVYLESAAVRGGIEVFAQRHIERLQAEGHQVECRNCLDDVELDSYDEIIVHKCGDLETLRRFPAQRTVYYIHDHEPICPRGYAYTPLKHNCSRAAGLWPCLLCAPLCRSWRSALYRTLTQKARIRVMASFRQLVVISNFMKSRLVANGLPADRILIQPPRMDAWQAQANDKATESTPAPSATDKATKTIPPVSKNPSLAGDSFAATGISGDEALNWVGGGGGPTRGNSKGPACQAGAAGRRPVDLLYVGQLIRGKGVDLLLRAMARMERRRTLDIVGAGNMEGRLKALAAKLGLSSRVRFRGFQTNPGAWMAAAQCVVVPSFWQEPYGLVAAEAIALGRPVVAFAIGGLPEACQGGNEGQVTLVPPGDIGALAAALDAAPPPPPPVKVFVFVDALGWKQVTKYGFLEELLPYRRPIEMQFGYSCTAIPTILTGQRPSVHGHLAFYDWSPQRSPFRAMGILAHLLRPRSFWRRGRVRHLLSRLIKRLYGFTGYFQLYGVPIERLPLLDYCEKQDLFVPGGLAPVSNLADTWLQQGLRYHISDWRRPEEENFRVATELLGAGKLDRAFVYSAAFDALQHDCVGQDEALAPKVRQYAERIRELHRALVAAGRPFELTVFSDHGMTPLKGTIDAPAALAATGLTWGKDYASAIDSTMARFWWLSPQAQAKVEAAFRDFPGHWLTREEMEYHGIWRPDGKFGEAIFLAEAGVQFCPSDMGVKPLNGMHGFDPADPDSQACWLSTAPVPAGVARVCDYFRVMAST